MIHYHGLPITPKKVLLALQGRHFCVSYAWPEQVDLAHKIGQSVMLDNGAYTIWKRGDGTINTRNYYRWVRPWLDYPTSWCLIPDIIDGSEMDNERQVAQWYAITGTFKQASPVWHLHESLERLDRLVNGFDRVSLGSSAEYKTVGTENWHHRMNEAFEIICRGSGRPRTWIHMLRGLSLAHNESDYPFASADSTNIAQNHYRQRSKVEDKVRWAMETAFAIDRLQCPATWIKSVE